MNKNIRVAVSIGLNIPHSAWLNLTIHRSHKVIRRAISYVRPELFLQEFSDSADGLQSSEFIRLLGVPLRKLTVRSGSDRGPTNAAFHAEAVRAKLFSPARLVPCRGGVAQHSMRSSCFVKSHEEPHGGLLQRLPSERNLPRSGVIGVVALRAPSVLSGRSSGLLHLENPTAI